MAGVDLPHNPSSPIKLYQIVKKGATDLWEYTKERYIPGLKLHIKYKKQPYGASCTVTWFPRTYCHCNQDECLGQYPLREVTMIVNNDFAVASFEHSLMAEKHWLQNFVCSSN